MTDQELLRQYVDKASERAFAELVNRHLRLVYWTCRRELDDAQLAEDVAQVVFILLARKAAVLRKHDSISGWLFKTARLASKNAMRREAHQRKMQYRVAAQMEGDAGSDARWSDVQHVLNDGLSSLADADRQAIVMRYLDGLSFGELGGALGLSEDAARMRTARAVSKLRTKLEKAGVTITVAALALMLDQNVSQAAPIGFAKAVHQAVRDSLAGPRAALAGHSLPSVHRQAQELLRIALRRKIAGAVAAGTTAAVCVVTPFVMSSRMNMLTMAALPQALADEIAGAGNSAGDGDSGSDAAFGKSIVHRRPAVQPQRVKPMEARAAKPAIPAHRRLIVRVDLTGSPFKAPASHAPVTVSLPHPIIVQEPVIEPRSNPAAPPSSPVPAPAQHPFTEYRMAGIVRGDGMGVAAVLITNGQAEEVHLGNFVGNGGRIDQISPDHLVIRDPSGGIVTVPLGSTAIHVPNSVAPKPAFIGVE